MKIKPIKFNSEMVLAILENRKTQTRRIIKETPGVCMFCGCTEYDCINCIKKTGDPCWWLNENGTICSSCATLPTDKAKFQPGDILWVREPWNYWSVPNRAFIYKATDLRSCGHSWKSSIHMPKAAARIFLKVISVRVERLQEITERDSIKEGVRIVHYSKTNRKGYLNPMRTDNAIFETGFSAFQNLWIKIYGKQGWKNNPFIWVYEFERTKKPVNFI